MPPCDMEGASAQGYPYPEAGMYLRDYFAAKAMQGMICSPFPDVSLPTEIAETAYLMADAMLKERSK